MQQLRLTLTKSFISAIFTFILGYSSISSASLSTHPATPTQLHSRTFTHSQQIRAQAATPEQIARVKGGESQLAKIKAKVAVPVADVVAKNTSISNAKAKNASQRVLSAYHNWAGTRYRFGGTDRSGIDCSAFVREAMSSAFNIHLPRSTAEQKHIGRSVSKAELTPGDLIFFRQNHHVGVYIGGGKFVHSSSSRGVTTSSLSESYWARNYTQSRRVL